MNLLHRFRVTAAWVLVEHYNGKQGALASELQELLRLDNVDLAPAVSRYLAYEVEYSGHFEPLYLLFWRDVVAGDYPLTFLTWLERAYAAYDSSPSGHSPSIGEAGPSASRKRDLWKVRSLLAESRILFRKSDANEEGESTAPRLQAARHLMKGIAVGLEQRTLGTDQAHIKRAIVDLKAAVRLFLTLKPREIRLSLSDRFHAALAVHMADWLLSEIPSGEGLRRNELAELNALGGLDAYAWLAERSRNWVHVYNVTEIYGDLGDEDEKAEAYLCQAIDLNPRLADFGHRTGFDGLDEALVDAPALKRIIPILQKKRKTGLERRIAVYREHAQLYRENVQEGIKSMLKHLKGSNELKMLQVSRKTNRRSLAFLLLVCGTTGIGLLISSAAFAALKPIF